MLFNRSSLGVSLNPTKATRQHFLPLDLTRLLLPSLFRIFAMEQDYNNMSIVTSNNSLPMRNHNGTEMLDEHGRVVYRGQFLATHPLRSDVKERREGNFVATYLSGDSVIRTMNAAFGHGNWSTEITSKQQVVRMYMLFSLNIVLLINLIAHSFHLFSCLGMQIFQ